ncbi:HlyD family efflux transporter periplasmic adaptor subunit [Microcella sp.]|uniref:HlyD family efflux transporter periplasmic adaptor subunit n=1 Tax=Microcella sp. TaxID=1913979 RepID=UPI0025668F12|nr:HlyD family efflux transporter periplasmic adaptor subunit [Microcella sp.]MBX9471091.1 HlyD family efflux transporter periplasmic adaptor subunit [Microcella sp.]
MTWSTRFRLFFGTILVVALVAALTVALSQRKGEATATSAQIDAVNYGVGSDYPGPVVEQFVSRGDLVNPGDPIATIQSNDLLRDLNDDLVVQSTEVYRVNADGTLTVTSAVTGIVLDVEVPQGAYAPAGASIASIAATETLSVTAEFRLTPTDFARIYEGAQVVVALPDGTQLIGEAGPVETTTADGDAIAVVTVLIDQRQFDELDNFILPGTPVNATMDLRNDDALAAFTDAVREFIADVRTALDL